MEIDEFYHTPDTAVGVMPILKHLNKKVKEKDAKYISDLYSKLDVKKMSDTALVGVLKVAYPLRSKISAYSDFVERLGDELDVRKKDFKEILRGELK